MSDKLKTIPLDTLIDKHIGKPGTPQRDVFENELRNDLLGYTIKQARKSRKLTQEELGKLVGVQKAQISRIENSVKDIPLETLLKIFEVLDAKITFKIELSNAREYTL